MRDGHRAEAERLLVRAVEEEVRRSGGRIDGQLLLSRARGALGAMAEAAGEEYEAYVRALDETEAGRLTFGQRYAREGAGTALLVAVVAAVAAAGADLLLGTGSGTAVGAGAAAGVVGAAASVVKAAGAHLPAAHHRAGAAGQPGGPEQLRLQWLTALEVRGIRPFLDQQRVLTAATARKKKGGPALRGADKSAAARRRSVLEQSFGQLPDRDGPFAGRRAELARIRQWAQAARAATETRPTVVVLHGEPGSGRTTLAVRAAHELRDHFRGAVVVDLRGGRREEPPLSTRDALLHLLNRLGAPREQLLFRERSSPDQQVKRLGELYHQQLSGLPVTIVLDDASDPEQVRALVPERSDSLVLVTARTALDLPADLPAWVHDLPVEALDAAGAEELLGAVAEDASGPYDAESADRIRDLTGGLPLALRIAGSALGPRSPRQLATDLGAYGPVEPVERALWLRYTDQPEPARRLLRRLALAGAAGRGRPDQERRPQDDQAEQAAG
ncbi:AAA family ATPase, partial [Streptomyces sp. NPDC003233]